MLVDMRKSLVKSRNFLVIMKYHIDKNVTTIKQVYNVINVYRWSKQDYEIEIDNWWFYFSETCIL